MNTCIRTFSSRIQHINYTIITPPDMWNKPCDDLHDVLRCLFFANNNGKASIKILQTPPWYNISIDPCLCRLPILIAWTVLYAKLTKTTYLTSKYENNDSIHLQHVNICGNIASFGHY
ncbi:hypothetical protein BVRB_3g067020 [Beta vulgaris subsp. vulgaris]|nr:hypothetical protein BVRB_3g067020 [Beta vulgaris subsp. vulgaris]